jgi:hypothetical protein
MNDNEDCKIFGHFYKETWHKDVLYRACVFCNRTEIRTGNQKEGYAWQRVNHLEVK